MRSVSNTNVGDVLTEAFVQDVRAHMTNSAMHSGIGGGSTDVTTHNSSTTSHTDIRNAIAALQAGGAGGDINAHNSSNAAHADIRTLISALTSSLNTHTANTSIHGGGGGGTDVTTHNNDAAAHSALLLSDSALPEIVTAYSGSAVPTTLATAANNSKRITALQIAKLIKGLPTSSANATNFDAATINVPYSAYNGARVDAILPYTKFNSKAFVNLSVMGWDPNRNYESSGYDTIALLMFVGPHDDVSGSQTFLYDWEVMPTTYSGTFVNKPIKMSAFVNGVSDNTKNLKVTFISRICNSGTYLSRLINLYNTLANTSSTTKTFANIVGNSSSDLNTVSMGGAAGFVSDGLSTYGMINDYQVKVECISVNK